MISQEKIKNTVQLTLITFDQFKTNYSKRNFLYEFGEKATTFIKKHRNDNDDRMESRPSLY